MRSETNPIVAAVNDHPEGKLARHKATDMAAQHHVPLVLVHVINVNLYHYIDRTNIEFRSSLAAQRRQMLVDYQHMCYQEAGISPKSELAFGKPEKILAKAIMKKYQPGLIVIGSRQRTGITKWLSDHLDRRINQRVPCDVLTVHVDKG